MDISNLRSYLSREYFFDVKINKQYLPYYAGITLFNVYDMADDDMLIAELYVEAKIAQYECDPVHCIIRCSKTSGSTVQYTVQYILFSNDLYISGDGDSFQTGIRERIYENYQNIFPTYRIYTRILGDTSAKIIMSDNDNVSSFESNEISGTNSFNSIKIGNWIIEQDSGNLVFREET